MNYCYYQSPFGQLLCLEQEQRLQQLSFVPKKTPSQLPVSWTQNARAFKDLFRQLDLYFQRKLTAFTVQLALPAKVTKLSTEIIQDHAAAKMFLKNSGTLFSQQVWQALQKIPYGQTLSYGVLAKRIAKPNAARAVGLAAKNNPFPIIIPCHRLIGSTGELVGFVAGLKIKRALLQLEGALV